MEREIRELLAQKLQMQEEMLLIEKKHNVEY